jgi:hypothetical protein
VPKFGSVVAAAAAATAAPCTSSPRVHPGTLAVLGAIVMGLGAFVPVQAAEAFSADAVKAEFLYRFASYVEWPAGLSDDAPFTIAVAADDGVYNELEHLLPGRTLQNRRVAIRKVSAVSELEHAQILYVPSRASQSARALLAAAVGRPILIVTDEAGGLAHGSVVNFVELERHVRFEISLTAAERSGLKINSGLLSVAAYVEGARPRADISCWQTLAFGLTPACALRAALAHNDPRGAAGARTEARGNASHS